jgi:zinc D-Ala-D-Ala carboxypeptidase
MSLSPNFSWEEVTRSHTAEREGIDNDVPSNLVHNIYRTAQFLEDVRALIQSPIRITSWYRSLALNTAIGGSQTSRHMHALAVDCQPIDVTRTIAVSLDATFEMIAGSFLPFDQLILERTKDGAKWLHIGLSSSQPRRQVLRADGDQLGGPMTFTRVATG